MLDGPLDNMGHSAPQSVVNLFHEAHVFIDEGGVFRFMEHIEMDLTLFGFQHVIHDAADHHVDVVGPIILVRIPVLRTPCAEIRGEDVRAAFLRGGFNGGFNGGFFGFVHAVHIVCQPVVHESKHGFALGGGSWVSASITSSITLTTVFGTEIRDVPKSMMTGIKPVSTVPYSGP